MGYVVYPGKNVRIDVSCFKSRRSGLRVVGKDPIRTSHCGSIRINRVEAKKKFSA